MSDFAPWLGICHIRQITSDNPDTQPTLVAVWTDSAEAFEREVHVSTNPHGLQMILAEEVLLAEDWQAKHPDRKDARGQGTDSRGAKKALGCVAQGAASPVAF